MMLFQFISHPMYRRILEVAAHGFLTRGYHGCSMREIGDAVGLQKGSLYHYVADKAHIALDLITALTHAIAAEPVETAMDPSSVLFTKSTQLACVPWQLLASGEPALRDAVQTYYQQLAHQIKPSRDKAMDSDLSEKDASYWSWLGYAFYHVMMQSSSTSAHVCW